MCQQDIQNTSMIYEYGSEKQLKPIQIQRLKPKQLKKTQILVLPIKRRYLQIIYDSTTLVVISVLSLTNNINSPRRKDTKYRQNFMFLQKTYSDRGGRNSRQRQIRLQVEQQKNEQQQYNLQMESDKISENGSSDSIHKTLSTPSKKKSRQHQQINEVLLVNHEHGYQTLFWEPHSQGKIKTKPQQTNRRKKQKKQKKRKKKEKNKNETSDQFLGNYRQHMKCDIKQGILYEMVQNEQQRQEEIQ